MRLRALLSLLCLACGAPAEPPRDATTDTPSPTDAAIDAATDARAAPGASLGDFQLTYYWLAAEEDFTGVPDTDIYDASCTVLATVPDAFARSLALEGSGRLADGRVLNYEGACSCPRSPCFVELGPTLPWGQGAGGRALVPFRSIAVDRSVITIGTALYVPELDGVTMPGDAPAGGFVHDGCVRADDTGGAITGMHIDFMAGTRAWYSALDASLGLARVTVYGGGARCP